MELVITELILRLLQLSSQPYQAPSLHAPATGWVFARHGMAWHGRYADGLGNEVRITEAKWHSEASTAVAAGRTNPTKRHHPGAPVPRPGFRHQPRAHIPAPALNVSSSTQSHGPARILGRPPRGAPCRLARRFGPGCPAFYPVDWSTSALLLPRGLAYLIWCMPRASTSAEMQDRGGVAGRLIIAVAAVIGG